MGYGKISFTPYKTTTYKFQTSKPWKEMEGKRILRNTKEEYVVLEEIKDAPFFSIETGRRGLMEIQERYHKANKLKSVWNPWNWSHFFLDSESKEILDEGKVKSLWNMWEDLWEHVVYTIPDDDDEDKDPDIDYNEVYEDWQRDFFLDIEISKKAGEIVKFCAENNYYLEIISYCD
jgi:hypothetical protein